VSNAATAELPRSGETLRRLRLERGIELSEAAAELGVPAKDLRALEWDRRDLLEGDDGDSIARRYAALLGLEAGEPAPAPAPAVAPAPPSRDVSRGEWLTVFAALGPPLVIAVPFVVEDVPPLTLGLAFLSSLLLVAAALPPAVVARAPVSVAAFGRYRESLGLAALGILVPVALFSTLAVLS
jgi:Helix-turn-helix domain